MEQRPCGLGDSEPQLSVYIANRPPLDEYQHLTGMRALVAGDIDWIARQTGNHWRKIFNVYAKLVFALAGQDFATWQAYRDGFLLRRESRQALLFSTPDLTRPGLHIITGRSYALSLQLDAELIAVDPDFQMDRSKRLLVVPYFDYRQLSNEKLARLLTLIHAMG